jgi:hypothetical protein
MKIELCFHYPHLNKSTSNIDDLVEEIGEELLKETPETTGVLLKTPREVMIQQIIQLYLDTLIDRIFDTDDDYMNNQRWKKHV